MTKTTSNTDGAHSLADLIRIYGADPARWPAEYAERYEEAAEDPETSLLLKQEKALDALLDRLPDAEIPGGAVQRLNERLAAEEPQRPESVVVPFSAAKRRQTRTGEGPFARTLTAASLMAASLLVGIFIGQSDLVTGLSTSLIAMFDPGSDVVGEAVYWLTLEPGSIVEDTL